MNDNSSMPKLYKPLEDYVHENFNGKVKVFHNPTRLGAIVTRVEGASRATGEVCLTFYFIIKLELHSFPDSYIFRLPYGSDHKLAASTSRPDHT